MAASMGVDPVKNSVTPFRFGQALRTMRLLVRLSRLATAVAYHRPPMAVRISRRLSSSALPEGRVRSDRLAVCLPRPWEARLQTCYVVEDLERARGFEPPTPTLARLQLPL